MSRSALKYKKMLFIGGGNIAGAVACGLVSSKVVPAEYVSVFDIDSSKSNKFTKYGISFFTNMDDAVNNVDIILLAVKPNIVSTVMKQLAEYEDLLDKVTIVSFAAAVSIKHITESCGKTVGVIRTMPSTPILVGEGVIAVAKNEHVAPSVFEYFCRLMSAIAHVTVIDEDLMNPIIAVHGSSPAYVYLFVKAMLEASVEQGISADDALPLILKTIKGSITMIEKADCSIDTLISNVASPNGTTLAALNSFQADDFVGTVSRAMEACTKRANEISEEL